jgi:hypothetical protein
MKIWRLSKAGVNRPRRKCRNLANTERNGVIMAARANGENNEISAHAKMKWRLSENNVSSAA